MEVAIDHGVLVVIGEEGKVPLPCQIVTHLLFILSARLFGPQRGVLRDGQRCLFGIGRKGFLRRRILFLMVDQHG